MVKTCDLCNVKVKRRHKITHKDYGPYFVCTYCLLRAKIRFPTEYKKLWRGLEKTRNNLMYTTVYLDLVEAQK